ncbi:hypothetical protein SARC_02085 [Sphaeroforma arctica JP610]|uniref:Uncharacterized protein n=1 Tax=Sphaeroforma arctica JP610 TaxID=667725 RepID=A0A0L0G9R8_9EUKA|nr:hypothetical protein SARC_02085 [Sphaeroforma arctica JP610]KNC85745.1 hypothetical protein SARC_02085 [Sphaeroforma arctica JP610]|eukprot:XP_014159647.1 hypothetical protein SARC_02085 [Sphaeroforma arctica JP610]
MASFQPPVFSTAKLLQCMNEIGFPMSEQDLKNPQPEELMSLYQSLVEELLGVRKIDHCQPDLRASDCLSHPDLYEEAIPQLVFYKALVRFMEVCGIKDFSFKDVAQPEFQRIRRIFSAVYNFYVFRHGRLQKYESVLQETEVLAESQKEAEAQLKALELEVSMLRAARDKEEPDVEAVRTEISGLDEELQKLNMKQARQRADIKEIDEVTNTFTLELAELTAQCVDLRKKNDTLKSKVVQSPDRMKRDIINLQQRVEKEKENIFEQDRTARELSVKHAKLIDTDKELNKVMHLMSEVQSEERKLENISVMKEKVMNEINIKVTQNEDVLAEERHIKKQIQHMQSKIAKVDQTANLRKCEAEERMEHLRQKKEDNEALVGSRQAKIDILKDKAAMEQAAHADAMRNLLSQYGGITRQIDGFTHDLERACQASSHVGAVKR